MLVFNVWCWRGQIHLCFNLDLGTAGSVSSVEHTDLLLVCRVKPSEWLGRAKPCGDLRRIALEFALKLTRT